MSILFDNKITLAKVGWASYNKMASHNQRFGIFFGKVFQKIVLKKIYYFVEVRVKKLPKNVIFKVFQVHPPILLLLKNNGYKSFYIIFEGPNVNEIISYFEHL
jgi:hypothetical protein